MKEASSAEVAIKEFRSKAASTAAVGGSFICFLARNDGSAPISAPGPPREQEGSRGSPALAAPFSWVAILATVSLDGNQNPYRRRRNSALSMCVDMFRKRFQAIRCRALSQRRVNA